MIKEDYMKKVLKNKVVILFYVSILLFSILWFWRVDKLEENTTNYEEYVVMNIK
jgi:hypothetical protein